MRKSIALLLVFVLLFPIIGTSAQTDDVVSDYFPMEIGSSWVYEIKVEPEATPMFYRETEWPVGGTRWVIGSTRGFYSSAMDSPDETFILKIKVVRHADSQASFTFPDGVELRVMEDGLGYYLDTNHVFWAHLPIESLQIVEVREYSVDQITVSAPDDAIDDGDTIRIQIFTAEEGSGFAFDAEGTDILFFKGVDLGVSGYKGEQLLRYQRVVAPWGDSLRPEDKLDQGFTEDYWFAKRIGLVRFEQHVGEDQVLSMTWTLTDYNIAE